MNKGKIIEERKKHIVAILMEIHSEERIKMIERFLILTLKREQAENEKD